MDASSILPPVCQGLFNTLESSRTWIKRDLVTPRGVLSARDKGKQIEPIQAYYENECVNKNRQKATVAGRSRTSTFRVELLMHNELMTC